MDRNVGSIFDSMPVTNESLYVLLWLKLGSSKHES